MLSEFNPNRYSVIHGKNPREIVMLRGSGCKWRRCRFCDYHLDSSPDANSNFILNQKELHKVTGIYHRLEVINSGSFVDLDAETISYIEEICLIKAIRELHFECHWMHRTSVSAFKARFAALGIRVTIKIGVETFDPLFRESYLDKGMPGVTPEDIADYFDEVCLLFGLPGQSAASMEYDLTTGLRLFQRVCVNIMQENNRPVKPDPSVIRIFIDEIMPLYLNTPHVDILMENTDFGVGGQKDAE